MARVGGEAKRRRPSENPEAAAAAAAAALGAFDSNGRKQRGGGRKRFCSSKSDGRLLSHLLLELVLPVQRRLHRVEELILVDQTVGSLLWRAGEGRELC